MVLYNAISRMFSYVYCIYTVTRKHFFKYIPFFVIHVRAHVTYLFNHTLTYYYPLQKVKIFYITHFIVLDLVISLLIFDVFSQTKQTKLHLWRFHSSTITPFYFNYSHMAYRSRKIVFWIRWLQIRVCSANEKIICVH